MNRNDRIAYRVARRICGDSLDESIRGEQKVRQWLVNAIHDLRGWLQNSRRDVGVRSDMEAALRSFMEALKALDRLIGSSLSEQADREMAFVSREAVSRHRNGNVWTGIPQMRRDIDAMAAQVKGWLIKEQEAVRSGRAGFSYSQYYGAVVEALDECSDRIRKVERVI